VGDGEQVGAQIRCAQFTRFVNKIVCFRQTHELFAQGRRQHGQLAAGAQQQLCFARSQETTAHDQGGFSFHIEEDG